MAVQLEIEDGSPYWWVSPDIWTVPGDDPEGTPGVPIVGQPCYLWARVHNNGKDAVANASVRFYWANPSVGFDRTTATYIGTSSVSLDAGETQEVLCLVQWHPSFVNGGHACILAEAFHAGQDPLPASPVFNVPTDRHVAQRNLSLLRTASKHSTFALSFEIHNPGREPRSFAVTGKAGDTNELQSLLKASGYQVPDGPGSVVETGFISDVHSCTTDEQPVPMVKDIKVAPGGRRGLTVTGKLEGEAAVVHVMQEADGVQLGGLSMVVVHSKQFDKEGE